MILTINLHRKFLAISTLFSIVLATSACDLLSPAEITQRVKDEFSEILPSYINSSFDLPESEQFSVSWWMDDQRLTDNHYVYSQPYADTILNLTAKASYGFSTIDISFNIPLIAPDSGYIVSTFDFDLLGSNYWDISRTEYSSASLTVTTEANGEPVENMTESSVQIRGRGNSTWWVYDKKPYRIKFDDDVSLLGMKPAKNYVLLAEHADRSFVRNVLSQKLAQLMDGIPYTIESRFVEVSFNGEYQGLYTLMEQVELNDTRYNIESTLALDDAGFLMELDWRQMVPESTSIEGVDYVEINDFPYVFQEPEISDNGFEQRHIDYMTDWIERMEMSLLVRQSYENYLDVDNWIDYFLIEEIVKNVDVGWSSFFFVKPTGGKIILGPLWDFDFAYGNADYIPYGPEGFWGFVNYKNKWFTMMMEIPTLRAQFVERFNEIKTEILPQWLALIPPMKVNLNSEATRNFVRWPILDTYLWPTPWQVLQANSHTKQMNYLADYLDDRIEWLDETLNSTQFINEDFTN